MFYRILTHHHPQKWNHQILLNKEWQRGQILKEAGKELDLDDKEFAYDAALQQIGFWKNSLHSPTEVKPTYKMGRKNSYFYIKNMRNIKIKQELFDFDDMLIWLL